MQKILTLFIFGLFSLLLPLSGSAQTSGSVWNFQSTPFQNKDSEPLIHANNAQYLDLDYYSIHQSVFVSGAGTLIELPLPSGKLLTFTLVENTLMAPGLSQKFPEVRAFNIVSTESRSIWGKFEISPKGVHAMIFIPGQSTLFIDPLYRDDQVHYIAYARKDFVTDKVMDCLVGSNSPKPPHSTDKSGSDYNDCQLRTYRLALAATGEYTIFQGGTVTDAFDAMVTTMNRVNGVYERDFGVTMTMVDNTDDLIYTNPSTDPYTNGNPGLMINQNQTNVDNVIGNANYDIGHVFGTNSGGLAGLGVTCNNSQKARGVTGSGAPVGDPFDIDYVAHEMGHEFGGNHSFNNSCGGNRNNATAVEPGSGSTIMGYAGICPPNIQAHSDDFFHGINMEEIGVQITNNTCQVNTPLENTSPEIADLAQTIYLPISTPFALTASASDADGDSLTYCWEQSDSEISTQPPAANATGGPNFQSLLPVVDSTRYFPSLQSIASGGPYTWERLPSVARNMSFRVSVRDNAPGGGCTQYADIEVETVAEAGPFKVEYPSDQGISWQGLDYEVIGWDVANTTASPINAGLVDIFLSTDGGNTYPIQIADDVENVGAYSAQVPNVSTTDARIMVMNSEGTFFDISNYDFTITSIENGFILTSDTLEYVACQSDMFDLNFSVASVGDFQDSIDFTLSNLPLDAMAILNSNQGSAGDTLTVSLISLNETPSGVYPLTVTGTSTGGFSNDITFTITVVANFPEAAQPLSPENVSENVPTFTTLEWTDNAGPLETYHLEVATDVNFTNVLTDVAGLEESSYPITGLTEETTYFWRVSNETACGISEPSEAFSFTTFTCNVSTPEDLPLAISATEPSTVTSTIEISEAGIIADLNVLGVEGTHTNVSDLQFLLQSPEGTEVVLASTLCGLNLTIAQNGDVTVNGSDPLETYPSSGAAQFGPGIPSNGITAIGVLALDGSDDPDELCGPAENTAQINGNIAFVYRGSCSYVQKVLNAQDAGAIAVIVINNTSGGFVDMGGSSNAITIPAVMVSLDDGNNLVAQAGMGSQNFQLSFDDQAQPGLIPCPATTNEAYQPDEPLSAFNGENTQGTWTLTIVDNTDTDGGMLNGWILNYCLTGENVNVSENELDVANIYPNPTSQKLTVALKSGIDADRILLYDMVGRVVKTVNVSGRRIVEVDLGQNPSGVYFVRLEGTGFNSVVYKVIKV